MLRKLGFITRCVLQDCIIAAVWLPLSVLMPRAMAIDSEHTGEARGGRTDHLPHSETVWNSRGQLQGRCPDDRLPR